MAASIPTLISLVVIPAQWTVPRVVIARQSETLATLLESVGASASQTAATQSVLVVANVVLWLVVRDGSAQRQCVGNKERTARG